MRPATKWLERTIAAVTLYRPDLVVLFDLVAQSGSEVKVRTRDFEYDSSAEFLNSDQDRSPSYLRIQNAAMDVAIRVNRTSTTVVVYATSLVMDGLFHRICEFLVMHQRPFHFGYSWGRLTGTVSILNCLSASLSAGLAYLNYYNYYVPVSRPYGLLGVMLTISCISLYYLSAIFRRSAVYANRDYPTQGFFSRNRDFLIAGSITVIIGGLVVLAVQLYWGPAPGP